MIRTKDHRTELRFRLFLGPMVTLSMHLHLPSIVLHLLQMTINDLINVWSTNKMQQLH